MTATASTTRIAGWMIASGSIGAIVGLVIAVLPFASQSTRLWLGLPVAIAAGGGLASLGALSAVVGLALYVLVPAFSPDAAGKDYGSHRVVLATTILAAIVGGLLTLLYFLTVVLLSPHSGLPALSSLAGRRLSPLDISMMALATDVPLLAVVYVRVVRPGVVSWSRMGLSRKGLGGKLLLGVGFGLLLFTASGILELLLDRLGVHQTQMAIFESIRRASLQEFGLVLVVGAMAVPVVEEIFFRGYIFRAYLDQKGTVQAFLFSSLLFALAHQNLEALLPLFCMALLLSYVFYRSGSVIPGIVAHALNNAVAFTALYLGVGG